jgi:hypothetical protein
MPRAKTVLGIPTTAKLPSKPAVMQIPAILPRCDVKGSRAVRGFDATPGPVIQARAASRDAVPDPIAVADHDTVRDEIPFALRNELRLLESASVARRVEVDVDVGWDVEQPLPAAQLVGLPSPGEILAPTPEAILAPAPKAILAPAPEAILAPAPEAILAPAPEAILEPAPEAVPEPIAADGSVQAIVAQEVVREPVTVAETTERTATPSDEAPVASCDDGAPPLTISEFACDAVTAPEDAATRDDADELPIASSWWRSSLRWAARVAIASALFVTSAAITASIGRPSPPAATEREAPAAYSTMPSASSQTSTPPPSSAQDDQVAVRQPQQQPTAAAQQPAAASKKKPARSLAATRPGRPLVSKKRCASLDCL